MSAPPVKRLPCNMGGPPAWGECGLGPPEGEFPPNTKYGPWAQEFGGSGLSTSREASEVCKQHTAKPLQPPASGRRSRSTGPAEVVYLSGRASPAFFTGSAPTPRAEESGAAILVFDVGLRDDAQTGAGQRSRGDSLFLRGLADDSISTIEGSEGEEAGPTKCDEESSSSDGVCVVYGAPSKRAPGSGVISGWPAQLGRASGRPLVPAGGR